MNTCNTSKDILSGVFSYCRSIERISRRGQIHNKTSTTSWISLVGIKYTISFNSLTLYNGHGTVFLNLFAIVRVFTK
jgi:hypothetical protein